MVLVFGLRKRKRALKLMREQDGSRFFCSGTTTPMRLWSETTGAAPAGLAATASTHGHKVPGS
jgi:hypothetical protein